MSAIKAQKNGKEDSQKRRRIAPASGADWSSVDPRLIAWLVVNITRQGGAVRFGYTSDGGAYSIGIYGDGEPYTEYLRHTDDLGQQLQAIAEAWAE